MRRVAAIIGLLGVVALVVFGQAAGGGGGSYEVRAIFDNGNFLVSGENVRVAGANVGTVSSADVTMPGDWVHKSCAPGAPASGCEEAGKAAVVLTITDSGFQDFRQDASCLIRPQSLLGEKYIDCQPTRPRPAGTPPPPPLTVIPPGQAGAGQRFLPLENNGEAVDLDLVNNIMREPYADRFRLILNSLGAGLAARGKTLDAIIKRADPALQQTDRVLAILAHQNHQLASLASNSDTILAPLARERQHVAGFINNANTAGQATAERSQALEAGFQKFPAALHQLRLEMAKLRQFSDQATPVFAEFRAGAPAIARSTRALGSFAHAATPALTTLGTALQASKQPLVNSDPTIKKIRDLAKKGAPGTKTLGRLLASLRKTNGDKYLLQFLFNTTGGINGYDQYGHFLRAGLLIPPACTYLAVYVIAGCAANWGTSNTKSKAAAIAAQRAYEKKVAQGASPVAAQKAVAKDFAQASGGIPYPHGGNTPSGAPPPGQPLDAQGQPAGGTTTTPSAPAGGGGLSLGAIRHMLDTMIGSPVSGKGGRP